VPRIRVEWLNTRTAEQRREIAQRVTQAFVDVVAVRPDQVTVVFEEIDPRLQAKGGVFWNELLKNRS
jgi:phenylpyruvate tautomerase PptA (4-oxalocrotonate tautomerase family)